MAQNNEFLTRIGLKYDTLENWVKAENQFILKAGEVAFATVAAAAEGNAGLAEPVIMMKIGDGLQTFNELKWAFHAKAADVYGWAKKATPDWEDFKNVIPTSFDTNTDTRTSVAINEDEGKLTITTQLYDKGVAQGEADVKVFDVVSAKELETALAGYYTKDEVDGLLEDAADAVTETLKGYYTIEAADAKFETIANVNAYKQSNDAALAGVKATAEAAVTDAKLATALEDYYTESEADAKFDAIGAAAAVLGVEGDTADKATVYGAKAAAAAAQSTADNAKARIDAFIDGTAEAESAIDTLVEIQKYITDDTAAFVTLSEKVDDIEDGTITVAKAAEADYALTADTATTASYADTAGTADEATHATSADTAEEAVHAGDADHATSADDATKLNGQEASYYATAQSVADIVSGTTVVNKATYADEATHATNAAEAEHAAKATNADNADQLGGQLPAYYATAQSVTDTNTRIDDLTIDQVGQKENTYVYFNCGSATTIVD